MTQLVTKGVNQEWKEAFRPEYGETEEKKGITSHFGCHWFSSYCRLLIGMSRERIQYMRGDRIQPRDDLSDAIDEYIHPNYDHGEEVYRNEIFELEVPMRHVGPK